MIPVCSLSRWRCLLCFGMVQQQYPTMLYWRRFKPHFLLSAGFCREGQEDQGALCLPRQWDAQVGQWTVLHSPAVGSCQNRVSLRPVWEADAWLREDVMNSDDDGNDMLNHHVHKPFLNRLTNAQRELNETKSKSVTTLHSAEDEILQLREEWVMHLHAATKLFFLFSRWRKPVCVSVCG